MSEKLYIQRSEGYYPACFRYINQLWGPHTVDRFASLQTRQLDRFCSRYRNPRCEAVDAFTISCLKENNWIFLKHMSAGGENGYLTYPSVALSCVVAAPCQHRWVLESLHYGLNDIQTLPRIFPGRIYGEQCIHIRHSLISDSSPSCLLSLVAQVCAVFSIVLVLVLLSWLFTTQLCWPMHVVTYMM